MALSCRGGKRTSQMCLGLLKRNLLEEMLFRKNKKGEREKRSLLLNTCWSFLRHRLCGYNRQSLHPAPSFPSLVLSPHELLLPELGQPWGQATTPPS